MPVPVHFYHMVLHFMVILSQSMCLLICHGRSLLYRYVFIGFFADTLLVLKIKYTVQNYFMRRINQCYAVYIFQCHSNESLKSIRHRVANRLNTNHEQIQLSTSEKLVCKNSLCCLT